MIDYFESIIFLVCTIILFMQYSKLYDDVLVIKSHIRDNNFWYQVSKNYISKEIFEKIKGEYENEKE